MTRWLTIALLLVAGMGHAVTYYVQPGIGADINLGTSAGAGNSWATTQKALDDADDGDEVRLCPSGTETTAVVIDADTQIGAIDSRIEFTSYNSAGTVQTDGYTIQASGAIAAIINFASGAAGYSTWTGVVFDGNKPGNATSCIVAADPTTGLVFERCELMNATSYGFDNDAGGTTSLQSPTFIDCEIHDNDSHGIFPRSANDAQIEASGCDFYDNGGAGLWVNGTQLRLYFCKFWGNTLEGLLADRYVDVGEIIGCTFDDNGNDGIEFTGADPIGFSVVIRNCAFTRNGAYGIRYATFYTLWSVNDYNFFGSGADVNTSGETDLGTTPGTNNQAGVAGYVDADNGDFQPGTGSNLIGNGMAGSDIGAVAHADGGGGTAYRPRMRIHGN